jgi:hypothetical protein
MPTCPSVSSPTPLLDIPFEPPPPPNVPLPPLPPRYTPAGFSTAISSPQTSS